jgi:hypothetical protein
MLIAGRILARLASVAQDLTMALMRATYKLEQVQLDGTRIVGTGWLVRLPAPAEGRPNYALVTARHVFDRMRKPEATVHWRRQDDVGAWVREARPLMVRSETGAPLFLEHGQRDVAVMPVTPPKHSEAAAIDLAMLADVDTFADHDIRPGDEFLCLGYPKGITANDAGFPILRSGRVASYPLSPPTQYPTFLMDFAVFAGNSGGPVYMSERARRRAGSLDFENAQFIAGMLAQQVVLTEERLEIGIVIHAMYVREALQKLQTTPMAAVA